MQGVNDQALAVCCNGTQCRNCGRLVIWEIVILKWIILNDNPETFCGVCSCSVCADKHNSCLLNGKESRLAPLFGASCRATKLQCVIQDKINFCGFDSCILWPLIQPVFVLTSHFQKALILCLMSQKHLWLCEAFADFLRHGKTLWGVARHCGTSDDHFGPDDSQCTKHPVIKKMFGNCT